MTERWGSRVCQFELRSCQGQGAVLHTQGATSSRGCAAARIDLTCAGDSMDVREVPTDTPQDVAIGTLHRAAAAQ